MRRILAFSLGLNAAFAGLLVFQHVMLRGAADRWSGLATEAVASYQECVESHGECVGLVRECRSGLRLAQGKLDALREVSRVPYANPGANCLDHSRALVRALAERGIQSYVAVADDRSHAWVLVSVEPTPGFPWSGGIVPLGKDRPILELRDGALKVVLE